MDPGPRFEEHIKTAHPYKCGICDLRYVEEEKLRKHKKSHQKGKVKEETNERKAVDVEKYFQPASETKAAPQKNSNNVRLGRPQVRVSADRIASVLADIPCPLHVCD